MLAFVIGSFYNTFCINILMLFCLFIISSIALGPRIVALRPLEELIPGILAASKATSTVKGYNSHFRKRKVQRCFLPSANNDLPDRVIKKHGRWKSEKAKK